MVTREKNWTVTELSEAANLSDARIRQLLLSGQLDGFKLGPIWAIPDSEARRYLESRKNREKKKE